MKNIFILSIILLFSTVINAQITIADKNGTDLTNKTAFLPSDEKVYFQITNNSASQITFIVTVTATIVPADALLTVCACGNCVPISNPPQQIGGATQLAPGAVYGTNDEADVEYISNASTGHASITIKVHEQGNEANFAEFTLDNQTPSNILAVSNSVVSLYPNPAKNFINVKTDLKNSVIVIRNIIGKEVLRYNLTKISNNISVASLPSGVYIYNIISKGKNIETKKLIINQ